MDKKKIIICAAKSNGFGDLMFALKIYAYCKRQYSDSAKIQVCCFDERCYDSILLLSPESKDDLIMRENNLDCDLVIYPCCDDSDFSFVNNETPALLISEYDKDSSGALQRAEEHFKNKLLLIEAGLGEKKYGLMFELLSIPDLPQTPSPLETLCYCSWMPGAGLKALISYYSTHHKESNISITMICNKSTFHPEYIYQDPKVKEYNLNEKKDTLILKSGKIITINKEEWIENKEVCRLLKHASSHNGLAVVTGDQSTSEALALKVKFIYEELNHKKSFFKRLESVAESWVKSVGSDGIKQQDFLQTLSKLKISTHSPNVDILMDKEQYDSMFTAFCEHLKMAHNLANELDTCIEELLSPEETPLNSNHVPSGASDKNHQLAGRFDFSGQKKQHVAEGVIACGMDDEYEESNEMSPSIFPTF